MTTVKEIEKKLEPLTQLHELSQSTDERLASLNALSEHVSRKAKAIESQQQAVEHAVVQANRVSEMVWSMDVQIAKLNEGMKQAAKAEETIGRIEKLSDETDQRMDSVRQDQSRGPARDREAPEGLDLAARSDARGSRHAGDPEEGIRGVRRARAHAPDIGGRRGERAWSTLAAKEKNLSRSIRRSTASTSASKRCSRKPTI